MGGRQTGDTDTVARDAAVQYIVKEKLYLTALEMYQEMLDRGIVLAELKSLVEERTCLRLDASCEEAAACEEEPEGAEKAAATAKDADASMDVARRLSGELQHLVRENSVLVRRLDEAKKTQQAAKRDASLSHELVVMSEQLKQQESREAETLDLFAERLPNVITSVRSSQKDALIQIMLAVIERHPAPRIRASLLFHLVTLFKRPDDDQRHQLTEGLRQLAQRVAKTDAARVESELLAAVRGLTEYRYPEQRLLAVEATKALYQYLHPSQRELVVHMFKAWLCDSSSSVREAAVVSVAELKLPCPYGELLVKALGDPSMRVQKAALQRALPVVATLAAQNNTLVPSLFSPLIDSLHLDISQSRVAAIDYCLTALRVHILSSVPSVLGVPEDDLSTLMSRAIAREVKGIWPIGEWVMGPFIIKVLHIIATTQAPNQDFAVGVLSSTVLTLTPVLDRVVSPLFTDLVLQGTKVFHEAGGAASDDAGDGDAKPSWELFRPFVRYTLTLDTSKSEMNTISELIQHALIQCRFDSEQLIEFSKVLAEVADEYDEVQIRAVDVLWNTVPHEDKELRRTALACFNFLLHARCLDQQLVTKRVLPALISISADPSDDVRVAAVGCTAFLATQLSEADLLHKLGSSLQASFRFDLTSCRPWLQALVNNVAKMPPPFISDHVFPVVLTTIGAMADASPQAEAEVDGLVPVLCDCVRTIAHLSHCEGQEGAKVSTIAASLKALAKALTDAGQKAAVVKVAREIETIDADNNKKDRFLTKFRDLLPNTDLDRQPAAQADAKSRASQTSGYARQNSPRASSDDQTPASLAHTTTAYTTQPSAQPQGYTHASAGDAPLQHQQQQPRSSRSLLSKVQKKLFGAPEGHP